MKPGAEALREVRKALGQHRKLEPAPPDPGIKPGGIRDRVLKALYRRSRSQQPK